MVKKTVAIDVSNNGKMVVHKVTKHQHKSTQKLIPLTPAPKTGWEKFKRKAWG